MSQRITSLDTTVGFSAVLQALFPLLDLRPVASGTAQTERSGNSTSNRHARSGIIQRVTHAINVASRTF